MSNEIALKQEQQLQLEIASFEFVQRKAKMYANSTMVPTQYRQFYEKGKSVVENPNAVSNCMIVIGIAAKFGLDEGTVFSNLNVIEGRPCWSSSWIAGIINSCGKFSKSVNVRVTDLGKKTVKYNVSYWDNGQRVNTTKTEEISDKEFIAYTYDLDGNLLEGVPITIEMAVKEGWYGKAGSKWQTMPDLMGRYRAISFFGNMHCPEFLKGMRCVHEVEDIVMTQNEEGVFVKNDEHFPAEIEKEETPIEKVINKVKARAKKEAPVVDEPITGQVVDAEFAEVDEVCFD